MFRNNQLEFEPNRLPLFLILCIAFLNYMGIGLVFPLFASLLFDPQIAPLPIDATISIRGLWMGILIALAPLAQFFFSPIFGSLSDQRGRKSMLILGLGIGFFGYILGILGVEFKSLILLVFYRILFGISASTMTVAQAALVDITLQEKKIRNFSLFNMAWGIGFTFGPFLGGKLSDSTIFSFFNYSTPFYFGALLTGLNLIALKWKFFETREPSLAGPIDFFKGIREAKKAFLHPTLRLVFLSFFLYAFGWDYFIEFIGVTLQMLFHFSTSQIGDFHAFNGLAYAVSVALLIHPFVKRYPKRKLLLFSMFMGGAYLLIFILIKKPVFLWPFLLGFCFIIALFYPIASTYISDNASEEAQGEILGIYHSIQALALILSPLISGSLVGAFPMMPIYLASGALLLSGAVFALNGFFVRNQVKQTWD